MNKSIHTCYIENTYEKLLAKQRAYVRHKAEVAKDTSIQFKKMIKRCNEIAPPNKFNEFNFSVLARKELEQETIKQVEALTSDIVVEEFMDA